MTCHRLGNMIVCTSGRTKKGKSFVRLCECGRDASLLCDWIIGKTKAGKPITCDEPICKRHAEQPDPHQDKHLCLAHAEAWKHHPANRSD